MHAITEQDLAFVNSALKQTCLPLTAVAYKEGIAFMPPRHLELSASFDQIKLTKEGYSLCWHEYIAQSADTPAHNTRHESGPYLALQDALCSYLSSYIRQIVYGVYEQTYVNLPY